MAKYNDTDGVWRTIGGRRVFIKEGQSLSDAMKESGKFKKKNIIETKDTTNEDKHKTKYNDGMDLPTRLAENGELAQKIIDDEEYNDIAVRTYTGDNVWVENERTGKKFKLGPYDTKETIETGIKETLNDTNTDLDTYKKANKEWKETQSKIEKDWEEFGTTSVENQKRLNELSRERDIAQSKLTSKQVQDAQKEFKKQINEGYEKFHGKTDKEISDAKDSRINEIEHQAKMINSRGYDDIDDVVSDFAEEQGIAPREAKYYLLKDEFETRQDLYNQARKDGSYSDSQLNHMESMARDSYEKMREAQEDIDSFNKENKQESGKFEPYPATDHKGDEYDDGSRIDAKGNRFFGKTREESQDQYIKDIKNAKDFNEIRQIAKKIDDEKTRNSVESRLFNLQVHGYDDKERIEYAKQYLEDDYNKMKSGEFKNLGNKFDYRTLNDELENLYEEHAQLKYGDNVKNREARLKENEAKIEQYRTKVQEARKGSKEEKQDMLSKETKGYRHLNEDNLKKGYEIEKVTDNGTYQVNYGNDEKALLIHQDDIGYYVRNGEKKEYFDSNMNRRLEREGVKGINDPKSMNDTIRESVNSVKREQAVKNLKKGLPNLDDKTARDYVAKLEGLTEQQQKLIEMKRSGQYKDLLGPSDEKSLREAIDRLTNENKNPSKPNIEYSEYNAKIDKENERRAKEYKENADWIRKAFAQYKKEHPNTKKTLNDFKKK